MLILGRKKGESIIINDEIEITILSISKNSVRLGIRADKKYTILRKELKEAVENSNIEATKINIENEELKKLAQKLK